ncbi:MAG: hypothetical protein AAF843_02675 [Bacteroidota bacterium]
MRTLLIILAVVGGIIGLIFMGLVIAANRRRPKFSNKGFTELEKNLLNELFDLFESDLSKKLKKQVAYFEPKQKWRQYWEKSMSIELYGDHDNPLSDKLRYNRRDESKLATIRFKVKSEKYSVEFDNYEGRLWGWKIRPNPKSIMKFDSFQVTSKKINTDPNSFTQLSFKKEKSKEVPTFTVWLSKLTEIDNIKGSWHPIGSEFLGKYTKCIDSKLPNGYLELIEQTEGLEFDQCRILGISEIYATGLDDGNYYHLAEFDDGIIAIEEGEQTGKMYFCQYSGLLDELSSDFEKELIKKNNKYDTTTRCIVHALRNTHHYT